jgi:hypothetical protein
MGDFDSRRGLSNDDRRPPSFPKLDIGFDIISAAGHQSTDLSKKDQIASDSPDTDDVVHRGAEVEHAVDLDTNVRPLIPLFSDCCQGNSLTLGDQATSVAESANAMIRHYLPGTALRLADFRKIVSRAYSHKRQAHHGHVRVSMSYERGMIGDAVWVVGVVSEKGSQGVVQDLRGPRRPSGE